MYFTLSLIYDPKNEVRPEAFAQRPFGNIEKHSLEYFASSGSSSRGFNA
jgi:hypothetical protein